jgi:P4 family phage/plasmid primase-like protien
MIGRKKDFTEKKAFYTDPDYLAEGFLNTNFIFDPGQKSLKGGAYTLRNWRDEFHKWEDGQYIKVTNTEMKILIKKHLHSLNEIVQYSDRDQDQKIRITAYLVNNILLCVSGMEGVHIPESRELNSWPDGREKLVNTIAVKNGLVLMDHKNPKPVLIKHTPDFFSITKLPFDYIPDAQCPKWLKFLNEVMQGNGDFILLLQQWTGYLFRQDLREQKFLLCTGEGGNGKGVFFEVIEALVGEENCSHIGVARFSNPFAPYSTLGKVVNATNESSHIINDEAESVLKSLVAGDRFTFDRKFKESINAVPTAKIMIATNSPPKFNDKTHGIWRRILFVPFDEVIAEEAQIKDLANQLKKELPGIFNWSLEGLRKLDDARDFIIPEKSKSLLEEYKRDENSARAFLQDNYVEDLESEGIPSAEVYKKYVQWSKDNGYRVLNEANFGKEVKRIFSKIQKIRKSMSGSRIQVYAGLAIQSDYGT